MVSIQFLSGVTLPIGLGLNKEPYGIAVADFYRLDTPPVAKPTVSKH